jgi:hypothetical protein
MITKSEIETLWQQLGDIPIDEMECIELDFHIWKKGTDRFERLKLERIMCPIKAPFSKLFGLSHKKYYRKNCLTSFVLI